MEKQLPLYITHDLDDWELNLNLFQVTWEYIISGVQDW